MYVIMYENKKYCKNYTLAFIEIDNKDLQHWMWPSLIKWSLTTILLRLKEIRYCSIEVHSKLWHITAFLNIELKKYKNLETKCVTTSPGLPYTLIFLPTTNIIYKSRMKLIKYFYRYIRVRNCWYDLSRNRLGRPHWWVSWEYVDFKLIICDEIE